jgi:hypothetical protein
VTGIVVGDELTGSYVFESTTAPRSGSTSSQAVFDALTSLTFSVGTYSASSTGAPEIQVDDDLGGPFGDRYLVLSRANDGLTGNPMNGIDLSSFALLLGDFPEQTAFTDALILPTNLSLDDFEINFFAIDWFEIGEDNDEAVSGRITELIFTPVPVPGTLLLVTAGLGAIAWLRRIR